MFFDQSNIVVQYTLKFKVLNGGLIMPESVIVVQRKGGGYVQGARVTLGFSIGVTDSVYTDSDGEANVQHSATGTATIYVDGRDVGTMNAPDRKIIFV